MQAFAIIVCLLGAAFRCPLSSADQARTVRVGLFSGRGFVACTISSQSSLDADLMTMDAGAGWRPVARRTGLPQPVSLTRAGGKARASSPSPESEALAERWVFSSPTPITVQPQVGSARSYRGRIEITPTGEGLLIVNEVDLEDYLRGVLPAEIPASFHEEALKAQAIAARTFAMANLGKHRAQGYDLCDQTHCQVYPGASVEDPRLDAAVAATAGLIVTYEGKPIHAVYHDCCGGRTAGNETAWQGSAPLPYLRPVSDCEGGSPLCGQSPNATWTRQVSQAKLGAALARFGVQGAVTGIEAAHCDENGRPQEYRVRSQAGEVAIAAGVLRSAVNAALGWDTLPSADFQAAMNGDAIVFAGRGNGHGVGLCQWGANAMARKGKTAEEILKRYYSGVMIEQIR
jgi:stage II sporulation protein D